MTLSPPVPQNWVARYGPQAADFNTYIRDAFNFLAGPPRLRVAANAVQSGIASDTWTTIVLQSVLEDNYSGWTAGASNYYEAQQPGCYAITFRTDAAIPAAQVARVGLLYEINGTNVGPWEFNQDMSGLNPWGWDCYDEIYLEAGDRVWPQFYQEYTASISTSLNFPSSLEIVWFSK